jgi:hypothetical protein
MLTKISFHQGVFRHETFLGITGFGSGVLGMYGYGCMGLVWEYIIIIIIIIIIALS